MLFASKYFTLILIFFMLAMESFLRYVFCVCFQKGLVGFFVCTCAYIVYVHLMLSARQTLEKQNRKYSFQDASSYELQSLDETPPQLQITEVKTCWRLSYA